MLEAQNITVKYNSRDAVSGVSLRAETGLIVAIIGPNGAGKSTLLRALNGAVRPTHGTILLDGQAIDSYARRVVARRIAVVAQEADLRFPVTVFEFVLGGRYVWSKAGTWGWEADRDIEVTQRVLADTELTGFEARLMNELSGGERQRAVLARALATEAVVLLLDEPTANLDIAHQASMLRLVRKRADNRQTAAIVVTHDANLAAQFADRVMLMKHGRAIADGPPREILTAGLMRTVFDLEVLVDSHPISGAPRITPVL
jgi:iron complex transport system ATP-binding protein